VATVYSRATLIRAKGVELALCRAFNSVAVYRPVSGFFGAISRLGDGVFWYTLILALPIVDGSQGMIAAGNMAVIGAVTLVLYKWLKAYTSRPRPFDASDGIVKAAPALDAYSFPSGHTLHAVSFTITANAYYPELAAITIPFATLVAVSRLVLGLHYPTDVLAGAFLGAVVCELLLFV
jgi:undecaprenyl-diphosphatase